MHTSCLRQVFQPESDDDKRWRLTIAEVDCSWRQCNCYADESPSARQQTLWNFPSVSIITHWVYTRRTGGSPAASIMLLKVRLANGLLNWESGRSNCVPLIVCCVNLTHQMEGFSKSVMLLVHISICERAHRKCLKMGGSLKKKQKKNLENYWMTNLPIGARPNSRLKSQPHAEQRCAVVFNQTLANSCHFLFFSKCEKAILFRQNCRNCCNSH